MQRVADLLPALNQANLPLEFRRIIASRKKGQGVKKRRKSRLYYKSEHSAHPAAHTGENSQRGASNIEYVPASQGTAGNIKYTPVCQQVPMRLGQIRPPSSLAAPRRSHLFQRRLSIDSTYLMAGPYDMSCWIRIGQVRVGIGAKAGHECSDASGSHMSPCLALSRPWADLERRDPYSKFVEESRMP